MYYVKYIIFFCFIIHVFYFVDVFANNRKQFFRQDFAGILVESNTGIVKYDHFASKTVYPASLTKLLTIYIVFDKIKKQELHWDTYFTASQKAIEQVPSKIGLKLKEKVSVKDALLLLTVKSANDVAYMVAENISGSVQEFANLMNQYAEFIGMHDSHFINPSGLHDDRQVTTVTDMAKLSIALKNNFPNYYFIFENNSCSFRNKKVKGHNAVLQNFKGATGLKTGFTYRSGFNIATSAIKEGRECVLVIVGSETSGIRDQRAMFLLNKYC